MNRYSRQIQLKEVGHLGQQKLGVARVLIVGVGGLGCPAAQYLAGAGVGKIGLIDPDKVSLSNLHRQILFDELDLGKPKVLVAKEKLQRLNKEVEIVAFEAALTLENAQSIFSNYDLILDGTDNFETKYLINDACILTGKPWVYASIYKNEGQLAVFNYKNGPSYRCLFSQPSTQNISCEATGVLGVVPGMFGILQAAEALKIILEKGAVLSGKLKLINMLSGLEQTLKIKPKPEEIDKIKKRGMVPLTFVCKAKDREKTFLDVREYFEQPRLNSAKIIEIPLGQLKERGREIPEKGEIFVFCQSGKRSLAAVELLQKEFGFQNVRNVEGGIKTLIDE